RPALGDLEVGGGDGQAAVVRDADLDLRPLVVAQQAGARRAVGSGQDFNPATGEADAGAVEALDHRLLGRPTARETFVVAGAVGELGGGVDLVQETGTGASHREGDPVNRDGVYTDALHATILGSGESAPPALPLRRLPLRRLRRHLPINGEEPPPRDWGGQSVPLFDG